jgi:multidrug efflux system outer membrane protein
MKVFTTLCCVLLASVLLSVSASCSFVPPVPDGLADMEVPQRFSASGVTRVPEKWWEAFGDETLNTLVEQALTENLDVLTAWDRLDQASALAGRAGSSSWPYVSADASTSHSDPKNKMVSPTTISLSASYEVDLWGRVSSARKAAEVDFQASHEDLRTVAISISASVAQNWYELVQLRGRLRLLSQQVNVNKQYLELVELRFKQGQTAIADVLQQRQQLASTESEITLTEMRLELVEHMLAILLGKPPTTEIPDVSGDLPSLPLMPETGLPSELLKSRPDVQAAYLRVVSANYRVGEAIANRFPSFSIRASTSGAGSTFKTVFSDWVGTIAGSVMGTIFDAGSRAREVDRTEAVTAERLHSYKMAVLQALKEVEDALVQETRQEQYIESLERQVELAKQALESSRKRYLQGASDYLPVLMSLQSLQRLQSSVLEAKKTNVFHRINLYRALGCGWELERAAGKSDKTVVKNGD